MDITIIALINVLSLLAPVILAVLIISFKLLKMKTTDEDSLKFKEIVKLISKYGSYMTFQKTINEIWRDTRLPIIGAFESEEYVTGYNISKHYCELSGLFLNSLKNPMVISMVKLNAKENYDEIVKIFKILFRFSLFLVLLITGFLFSLADFYLDFVYGESYLIFSPLLKLIFISLVFDVLYSLYVVLLRATNQVKLIPQIFILYIFLVISFFIVPLIFFGILAALIGEILAKILFLVFLTYFIKKKHKIKLDILKICLQYVIFFISLAITFILGNLILNQLSQALFINLNLSIFENLHFLELIVFIFTFLLLILLSRNFKRRDIEYIELLFIRDSFSHKMIRKFLKTIKILLK
jgi:O-antigen/teichoic acid export membrane protein